MGISVLLTVVAVYVVALSFLSWLGYKHTHSASDYLTAGGKVHPVLMALSYGAAFISASAIVGFGGVAATFGTGIEWLCFLNMFMGVIVAFLLFGRRTRRMGQEMGVQTFAEFMGKRFGSQFVTTFIAVTIFLCMPLYAAVVLKGGAVFLERIFALDYNIALLILTGLAALYVIMGGLKGVIYTDALQAVIMVTCMLFLLYKTLNFLDMGFSEANRALGEMSHLVPEKLQVLGHRGWTAMPAAGSPQWYTLVTSLILGVGIGCLAQPQLIVRFLTVKGKKELNRAVFVGCIFIFLTVGSIYHVGALSNLFFLKTEGKIASAVVPDMDKIIPYFISRAMPVWFSALFMLCILSASMSTLSALFHTMGSALGRDIYARFNKPSGWPVSMIRTGVLITIFISYIVCYLLEADVIARGTAIFMGICAASFLPAYFAALYCKKATLRGVKWSMITGLAASVFSLAFLHRSEAVALGLCQAIFGKPMLIEAYPWYMVDPILYALPLSVLALVLGSFWSEKKSDL